MCPSLAKRSKYNGRADIVRDIIQRPDEGGDPAVTDEQVHICVAPGSGVVISLGHGMQGCLRHAPIENFM